jgi:hypothetical protein
VYFEGSTAKAGMHSKVIGTLAALVTLAAWVAIFLSLHGGLGPRIDSKLPEATGWVMAQEALTRLQPSGQITVITRDTSTFKNPATDIQMASFRKALGRAHAAIRSLHTLQVDPLRPVEVPAGDFYGILKNTPKGNVVVSFMGPPMLTASQCAQLGENKPAVVAFCTGSLPALVDLSSLFEQGLLQAAVVDRSAGRTPGPRGSDLRAFFDQSYLVITAANLADIPAGVAGNP